MLKTAKAKLGAVLRWAADQNLGRDAMVVVGVLAFAAGAYEVHPALGKVTLGGLLLYIGLLHGAVVARLLRPTQKE